MKCLSLRQSYANLLVSGRRTIEVKKWNTNLRGKFPIPTSKNVSINKDPGRNCKDQGPPMQWGSASCVPFAICSLSWTFEAALLF